MSKRGLLAFIVVSTGILSAQVTAVPHRPANVPSDYVVTPFGYMHPSCTQTAKEGETLLANGMIQHTDGSKTGGNPCSYPSFASDGTQKDSNPKAVTPKSIAPQANGWMESAAVVAPTNHSYSGVISTNTVPNNPANDEGQTLFYFPGLQDVNDPTTSIVQPVLEYNSHTWTMTNWNCCINGVTTHGTSITTAPGHNIISTINENCGPNTLSCKTWNILSVDTKTKQSTLLSKTPSEGQVFNWALGGVLEVYGVNLCTDFPKEGETYQTIVFDEGFKPITPTWTVATNSTDTPQCGYKVQTKGDNVTLDYTPTAPTPITFTISPLSITTQQDNIAPGQSSSSAETSITVGNISPGQSATVTFGALPAGVSIGYNTIPTGVTSENPLMVDQNATVGITFETSSTTPVSTTTIPVTITTAGQSPITENVVLTVTAPPPVTLAVSPTSTTLVPGTGTTQTSSTPISITVGNLTSGESALVTLSNFPPGVSIGWLNTAGTSSGGGSSTGGTVTFVQNTTVTFAFTTYAAAPGTYTIPATTTVAGQPPITENLILTVN